MISRNIALGLLVVAMIAVLCSIVIINLPARADTPGQVECAEWRERPQVRKDWGATPGRVMECQSFRRAG